MSDSRTPTKITGMPRLTKKNIGVLLSRSGVLLSFLICIFFYICKNYLKYWGSIVGGVLLPLELYGRHTHNNGGNK
jgi:hypothetical protein